MYGFQQPPPRRRVGRKVLFIVLGVVLALCLCGGGFGFFLYTVLREASEAPRAATHAFVADLAAGNTQAAYGKLCARVRAQYTQSQFDQIVAGQPRPTKASISGFSVENDTAEIRTTLTLADGSERGHEFNLVDETGGWKVCGNPY
jgi:hypothetical protein